MTIEKLKPTFSLEQDLVEKLKQLIPEAVADGKINWNILKEALGEHLEEEGEVEHFGLNWAGKRQARRLASLPSKGTLVPVPGEGIDEETTGNVFIEGDNLEVLKLLQKSYAGRIKLIYIDPPYNTGNDFIYKDNYSDSLEEYLRKTGQIDKEGNLLNSNPKAGGRFHSNWLSMIYPRLKLAKNLLREDGMIFVSIDDNEVYHLKSIMNEIFGEENFLAQIAWQKRYTRSNNTNSFTSVIDYLLLYRKASEATVNLLSRDETTNSRYSNPDGDPRGLWKLIPFTNPLSPEERPNLVYEIINPYTQEKIFPEKKAWRASKNTFEKLQKENRVYWGKDGQSKMPGVKRFLSEVKEGVTPINFWSHDFAGHTDIANNEIKNLFGDKVFDTPKPIKLIKRILELSTSGNTLDDEICLDFFAGSGTMAHAVLEINKEDGGNRKFICIQIPEQIPENTTAYKKGYLSIHEISKERIRRAIKKITESDNNSLSFNACQQDRGFKVFTIQASSIKKWDNHQGKDIQTIQTLFLNFENPLIDGWKEADVVTEIQLVEGFPLDSKIEQASKFTKNRVLRVSSEYIGHKLFICLEAKLKTETIEQVNSLSFEDIFICLDNALTDEAKLQLSDGCNIKTI